MAVETLQGLSTQEAAARRAQGQGNDAKISTSRSYAEIIRGNVFNFFNMILFSIGAVMIGIGRVGDAVTSVGLIFVNVIIGMVQEVRAKQQLDQIALLTRPRVNALRDGAEQALDPAQLVIGDVIILRPGDQIVVDGVLRQGEVEADEALLTGETDLVKKRPGDNLLSGSFVVAGSGYMEAIQVGAESYANKLTASARQFTVAHTPLQREINFILRLLMLLAGFLGILFVISFALASTPFVRQVQAAAIIAGLIPNGLFFMVILSYAMGALRIVRRGALVQQSNAVEALSNVTVLCTDKTGTLTANRINYDSVHPISVDQAELERALGDFAASASANNKTGEALAKALTGTRHTVTDEVQFTSALKWSALSLDDDTRRGVYALGAVEMLMPHLTAELDPATLEQAQVWSNEGLRVLMLAHDPEPQALHTAAGDPTLPPLTPLGLVRFSDELRPHLKETLGEFVRNDIELKVISGDNPQTVAALARQAGFAGDLKYVSGLEIAEMDDTQLAAVVKETTIFGRITPEQKERLVDTLRAQGHYVAMIGDGVNDVLSLKKADMGIAMESGSSATRAVADMILLGDSFEALPPAFTEGQRIVNGMGDILRLFMTRVLYSALLIIATAVIGVGFPYLPKHNALLVFLSVGIPTLGLAVWARPGAQRRGSLLKSILHFVIPAAFMVLLFGLGVYLVTFFVSAFRLVDFEITPAEIALFQEYVGIDYSIVDADQYILEVSHLTAQTALTAFTTFAGLLLLIFAEPPTKWFVGGDELSGDKRPTYLALALLIVFFTIVTIDPIRAFFELVDLPLYVYLILMGVTAVWALILRASWRGRWLQRFLGVEF